MRLPLIGLAATGILLGQAALATTSSCVHPEDRAALDVEGLKSELMVIALDCDARDHYNAFVNRYKAELTSGEKQLGGYFTRAYGRTSRSQQDNYVTQLANGQSQAGTKEGTLFCGQHMAMFEQVMALRSAQELSEYAAGQELAQPISVETCTTPDRPIVRVAARRTVHHTKHQ